MPDKTIPVPATVGDAIKFLQQFPEDYTFDLFKLEYYDNGGTGETCVYNLNVNTLEHARALEITCN